MKIILKDSIQFKWQIPSPRIIKSHMPVSMLPPALFTSGCKVVYVCRNPKDTCVSYFHHTRLLFPHFSETFEHFETMFRQGKVEYGSYWYHLKVIFHLFPYILDVLLSVSQKVSHTRLGLSKLLTSNANDRLNNVVKQLFKSEEGILTFNNALELDSLLPQ